MGLLRDPKNIQQAKIGKGKRETKQKLKSSVMEQVVNKI